MDQWIKTNGVLTYDPTRYEFRKTFKARTLIVELRRGDLDLYYQWFLKKRYGEWLWLQRPMWGLHVTVVRGNEGVPDMTRWGAHAGEPIELEYGPQVTHRWGFWSLPVRGAGLKALRDELGLKVEHHFHLTIGRMLRTQMDAGWFK